MGIGQSASRALTRQYYNGSRLLQRIKTGRWPAQIVFLHVPKTGGSSVQNEFARYMGSTKLGHTVRFDSLYADPAEAEIARAREARFVAGHIDWAVFERFRQEDCYAFTVLRDPFGRLLSSYLYITNFPRDDARIGHLQGMGLKEFLTSEDPIVLRWSEGVLAKQFGGSFHDAAVSDVMIDRSIKNLRSMRYVAFQDRLDADFPIIAAGAGIPVPRQIEKTNVTAPDARKNETVALMTGDYKDLVARRIAADVTIYEAILDLRAKR